MQTDSPVLIVEDDQDIRESLAQLLELAGYVVLSAEGGIEGLRLLEQHRPFVILLDWMMPGMNGDVFLKEFQTNYPALAERIPVYLITAAGERAKPGPGIQGIFRKPIDADDLLSTLSGLHRDGRASR
jgi:CheY-like chemotaxis protein